MRSYLTNRHQYVSLNKTESNNKRIECGVPQGSILGPLLFLVFINDIFSLKLKGELQLFADDAILMFEANSADDLIIQMQTDLDTLSIWLKSNYLLLNTEKKTNYIIFNLGKRTCNPLGELKFENLAILRTTEVSYLGLINTQELKWHSHIDAIKKRIAPMIGAIKRLNPFAPTAVKKSLYFSFVYSHLTYLNTIWSNSPIYKIQELKTLQNRAIKAIFNMPYLTPTRSLYNSNFFPLTVLIEYLAIVLIHRIYNNLMKNCITFTQNRDVHHHNL